MKFFILFAFVVSAVLADDCSYDKLKEANTLESIIEGKSIKWPKSIAEVTDVCNKLKDGAAKAKAFNDKCIKKEKVLQILAQVHTGLKKHYDEVCGSDAGKQAFLERVKCYDNPQIKEAIKAVHERYVGLVEKLATFPKAEKLGAYCCSVLYIREAGKAANEKQCSKDLAEYVDRNIKAVLYDPFREFCGDIKTYQECATNLSPANAAAFQAIISANPPQKTQNLYALPTLFKLYFDNQ